MTPVPPAEKPCTAPPFDTWTLIVWRVIKGRERAFVEAWRDLRASLDALERPPCWCILLENQHEAGLFYAFGPWDDPGAVDAMRRDSTVQDAFQRLIDCCHEADFGTYGRIRQALPPC